jgi:hypothetical protein
MADNPKVRIGVSLGGAGVPGQFGVAVDALDKALLSHRGVRQLL